MTCIVAIKEGDKIYIGGDSAATAGNAVNVRLDPKVFKNGKFLIGYAGSYRMGQLMRFGFKPPKHAETKDNYEYMCTDFVNKIHHTFEKYGFSGENKRAEKETSGQMLIAYRGELYELYEDYQVGIVQPHYNAIGGGTDIALGSLFTSEDRGHSIEERIVIALDAACKFNNSVLPPYTILST